MTKNKTGGPHLLQHGDGVSAALQACGEAGRGGGIVVLCGLRQELAYRDLIRHPSTAELVPGGRRENRWKIQVAVGEIADCIYHMKLRKKQRSAGPEVCVSGQKAASDSSQNS